jgi:hypothetical protein
MISDGQTYVATTTADLADVPPTVLLAGAP